MDSAAWDARYSGADLVWSSAPNVVVEELAGPLTPGRALDVAAGEGRNAVWLAERGWDVTATDFSAVGLRRAEEVAARRLPAASARLRVLVADALEPPPAPEGGGGYDLVLFCYLQLPAAPWATALAHGVAAAAPGGRVLVVCHAERNLTEGVGGPQDPEVLHDPEAVLAAAAGLPVEVERAQLRRRPVPDADRDALDTVVVLVKAPDAAGA